MPVIPNVSALLHLVHETTALVAPESKLSVLADDPDNRVLEAAAAADADYIVTGDKAMLDLGRFDRTVIVTPRRFLEILDEAASDR
jgi:putative PIN family toxin of toxin-antitoxin system